jgi:hypothetical protein
MSFQYFWWGKGKEKEKQILTTVIFPLSVPSSLSCLVVSTRTVHVLPRDLYHGWPMAYLEY